MAYDGHFQDGFDQYGPLGFKAIDAGQPRPAGTALMLGKWTSIVYAGTAGSTADVTATVVDSLFGPGQAVKVACTAPAAGRSAGISVTHEASYAGVRFAGVFMTELTTLRQGFVFGDAGIGQVAITIEPSGQVAIRAGAVSGNLLALSAESVASFEAFSLAGMVTFDPAAGVAKVWLNNKVILDRDDLATQASANPTANQFQVWATGSGTDTDGSWIVVDHLYVDGYFDAGDLEAPIITLPSILTQFPIADDAVDFTAGAALLGPDHCATTTTNAPGANQLYLRRYVPDADGTLDVVSILPAATSATAKFKSLVYDDAAGVADTLLDVGGEIVGCVAGADLDLAVTAPVTVTKGAPLWLGVLTDTSVALHLTDTDNVEGYKAARTYGSGAPATAPALTPNQASWVIYGQVSGVTADYWSVVDQNPVSPAHSFLTSATPLDVAMFEFPVLDYTPTAIYCVEVGVVIWRASPGARTIDVLTTSAAATSAGNNTGQTPSTNPTTLVSQFFVDPDTLAAWNASGVNLARHGLQIAS